MIKKMEITILPLIQTQIYLIRHGETEWSHQKRHTGLSDIPLTEKGIKQAQALKIPLQHIVFKKIFCSPLKRAQKTCELTGFLDFAELSDELLEWDYGDYEGLTTEEIREKVKNWNIFEHGAANGEKLVEVGNRADRLLKKAATISGNVAFFGSGHILRVIAARWLGLTPDYGRFLSLSTASLSLLSYEHEWRTIAEWNNTSHLKI